MAADPADGREGSGSDRAMLWRPPGGMEHGILEETIRRWIGDKTFGQGISYAELYGLVDTHPCVWRVKALRGSSDSAKWSDEACGCGMHGADRDGRNGVAYGIFSV